MTIQHKATYRVNAIPIKLAMMSFPRTSTKIFSICMETQKTLNNLTKAVLTKKNGTGGTNFPDFRLYYRTPENKTVWYWHKNWNTDQCNKIEILEIYPCTYGHLIFDKGGKSIQWRKNSSLISGVGKTGELCIK